VRSWILGIIAGTIVAVVVVIVRSREPTFEQTAAGYKIVVPPRVRSEVPEAFRETLREAESIELISLDPFPEERDAEYRREHPSAGAPRLGDWAVHGTVLLDGAELARALNALYRGIGNGTGLPARIFQPRHALRVQVGHTILEVVMCYELESLQWRRNGHAFQVGTTSSAPRATLDAMLLAAGIPLGDR